MHQAETNISAAFMMHGVDNMALDNMALDNNGPWYRLAFAAIIFV